jgi:DNA-binding MarR family transcriptional regulator
LPKLVR